MSSYYQRYKKIEFPDEVLNFVHKNYIENVLTLNAIAQSAVKKYKVKMTYEHVAALAQLHNWPKRLSKKEKHIQQLTASL